MSWLFSRALEEAYSGENCSVGEPSVQLSGNPIPQAYLSQDKMTAFSRLFRFGMTFKLLTESRGEELCKSYREVFLARTSAQQVEAQALPEANQECGNTWQGLLGRYDPSTHSLKTAQCSLFEDLKPSSVTLPRWGLMQSGELYQRQTLVRPILESEFGSEPNDETFFHTPTTGGLDGGSNSRKALKKRMENWPTPTAHNAKEAASPSKFLRNTPTLAATVALRRFPTPTASDNRDRGNMSNPSIQRRIAIGKQIMLSQSVDQNSGQLNPTWVEKMMGWPDEWSSIQPISHVKMCFWFMGMNNGAQGRKNEVMRVLRYGHAAQEIQREIGRFVGISEAAILLAKLCEHAHRFDEARLFMACAKALEEEMRGVRLCESITSAPHRPKQDLQQTREYSDTMQALSRLLAHYGKTAWKNGSWEDAVPRVANGVAARMDRLKAIGNGQVPRVAETAWRLLK